MANEQSTSQDDLGGIERELSHQTHELANVLNEMTLHAAVLQATAAEPLRTELSQLQVHGRRAAKVLQAIQALRDRLRHFRPAEIPKS